MSEQKTENAGEEECESTVLQRLGSENNSVLFNRTPRTSVPSVIDRWKKYRKNTSTIESDETGFYKSIKENSSPPPDREEAAFKESIEHPRRISQNPAPFISLRQKLIELMKSYAGSAHDLEELENDGLTNEKLKQLFSACTVEQRNVAFLWCALQDKAHHLQVLYELGVDLHFYEPIDGLSALHYSALSNSTASTKFLIGCGMDINFTPEKFSPLETASFHNSCEVLQLLLDCEASVENINEDTQTNNWGTALHSAVKTNSIDCVKLLLAKGADVNFKGASGVTPLHIAAERGHSECLKLLLKHAADPNIAEVDTQATPLHNAAEGGFKECVSLMLTAGASQNAKNCKQQTALHLAARVQSLECVELLLKAEGSDPNVLDCDQRTPLHSALGRSLHAYEIAELLIRWGAKVNASDKFGYTPLHIAALNEELTCVELLIQNGANPSARTIGGNSALAIIVRKAPLALSEVYKKLDDAITMHDPEVSSSKEVILKLDFRILLQFPQKGEMNFLKIFLDEGQKTILEHPLCKAFLHIKWEKIRKYYIARLFFYALLVSALSAYVLIALSHGCYNLKVFEQANDAVNDTLIDSSVSGAPPVNETTINVTLLSCAKAELLPIKQLANVTFIRSLWYIVFILALFETLRKLCSVVTCTNYKRYFCHLDNIIEWFVLVSCILISCEFSEYTYRWQNHIGAIAVLLGWTNIMILIGQLPVLGSYVAMYIKVQKEFAKLFVAYFCLLLGFTCSFCVIFPGSHFFYTPFTGFIYIVTVMIGALDYDKMLYDKQQYLEITNNLIFLTFILFVTVILMNLLVGIAVHDIQGLKKTAGLSKLVRQTKLIASIEASLFADHMPSYLLKFFRYTALISPSGYRVVLQVKPLNRQEKRLPLDVLKEAYELAKSKKYDAKAASNSRLSKKFHIMSIKDNPKLRQPLLNRQNEKELISNLQLEIQELKELVLSLKQEHLNQ